MAMAFDLSAQLGLCPRKDAERVRRHLGGIGLPTSPLEVPGGLPDADALLALMAQDKKVSRGKLTFILTHGIGKSFVARDVPPNDVRAFMEDRLRP